MNCGSTANIMVTLALYILSKPANSLTHRSMKLKRLRYQMITVLHLNQQHFKNSATFLKCYTLFSADASNSFWQHIKNSGNVLTTYIIILWMWLLSEKLCWFILNSENVKNKQYYNEQQTAFHHIIGMIVILHSWCRIPATPLTFCYLNYFYTYPWLDKEPQNLTCFLSHRVGLCGLWSHPVAHHRVALISVSAALSQTPNYCARPQMHSYCITWCACLRLVFYTSTSLYSLVTEAHWCEQLV